MTHISLQGHSSFPGGNVQQTCPLLPAMQPTSSRTAAVIITFLENSRRSSQQRLPRQKIDLKFSRCKAVSPTDTNLLPSVLQLSNQHYIGAAVKEQEANQLGTLWKGEKEAGRELVALSYKSAHSCELDDSEQEKESLFQ